MIAGTLEIQMLANLARLSKDMADAKTMVGATMKNIESSVGLAKKALGALGIGLSVNYFANMIVGAIDAQDRLFDLSKTTRISVEDLSGLKLAAKQSGSDLEGIAQSINKLGQNIGKEGPKFRALGITAKEPIEAFKQLADIMNLIEDPQLRAAVAATALGKSWQGAAPLLAAGSVEIQRMIDRGKVLSGQTTEQARQADQLKDKYAELQIQMESATKKLANQMVPAFTEITSAISKAAEESGGWTAALVALGGAINFVFGQTSSQQAVERLREINAEIEALRKSVETKKLHTSGFWSFLFPPVGLGDQAVAAARDTIKRLEDERKRLLGIKDPPKLEGTEFDAHIRAKAAKDAAEFARRKDAALQEEKLFIGAMQRLEKEFFGLTHEGQVATTMYETMHGSLKGLTDEHKRLLLVKAAEIDAYKKEEQARKVVLDGIVAENAARTRAFEIVNAANVANAEHLEQMRFEASLIGVSRREAEQMNAARQIDLKLRQDIAALPTDDEGNLIGGEQAMGELRRQAEAQKRAVRENIAARQEAERNWLTGAKDFFNEYADLVSHTANMTNEAFSSAFRGMEDALVQFIKTGKLDFRSLADSIISDIIRIQVRQNITGPLAAAASRALTSVFSFAEGGIMTGSGPLPLRRYGVGGVADSAQLAMFGEGSTPEAFVPLPDGRNIPVKVQGAGRGSGANITIAPVFHVSAMDSRGVASYLASRECQRAILSAVNAAMLRGGSPGIG